MTVSTFYPDAHPETNTVDGYVVNDPAATSWATLHDALLGTSIGDSGGEAYLGYESGAGSPNWENMYRSFFLFNTGPTIPDGDTIDSATFEFVAVPTRYDVFLDSVSLVTSTPASNTALVTEDYDQLGTVTQANEPTFASLVVDSSTYTVLTLTATGRTNVSTTGVTKFGLRTVKDRANTEPAWAASSLSRIAVATAEEALAPEARPRLVVTHTAPPATFIPKMLVF